MNGTSKQWYVVTTHNKSEKKVCHLLHKKHLETFYPLCKKVQQSGDKNKVSHEPLLGNHVLIHASSHDLREIILTEGVRNLLYWHGEPAVINNDEVNMMKNIIRDHQHISIGKTHVSAHEKMAVKEYYEHGDSVYAGAKKRLIEVSLPSLGYTLTAELKPSEVRVISMQQFGLENTVGALV